MNVYITYDRYEHNEWLSVYHIETNKKRAIEHCKEVDLVDFISYGPDDCHSFQLQKVVMTKEQYKRFCYLVEHEGDPEVDQDEELKEMLVSIYDEDEKWDSEIIIQTDGCSDAFEVARFYCEENGIDIEDEEDIEEDAREILFNDDELFEQYLKKYIKVYY